MTESLPMATQEAPVPVYERLVLSLGGNAFAAADESMSMAGQFEFAARTLAPLAALLEGETELLLTHGNGPQVGYILTRVEAAIGKAYKLPLEVCVAESAGEIGYVLQQTVHNLTGGRRPVATLLTQVTVAADDPAFANPTKPVGPWLPPQHRASLERAELALISAPDGRVRRVVASPRPEAIVESDIIEQLLSMGIIVIAAGGGGIPVVATDRGLEGVEAVVDKDLATALLARMAAADCLVLVTGAAGVYRNFDSSQAELLTRVTPDELDTLAAQGQFPAGSMGPKVEAAAGFVRATGKPAIICQPADLASALAGRAGTHIAMEN